MGLLAEAEKKHELMEKLSGDNKQYVDQLPSEHKSLLQQGIEAQRAAATQQFGESPKEQEFEKTGIEGFDKLTDKGIPKGTASLICGGPGSGKTIFALQTLINGAMRGKKCFYMSFEESPERLRQHMHDFGWNPEELETSGHLMIQRFDPYGVTRAVEAVLEKAKGDLMIDVAPVVFPSDFKPDIVVVDSLSSIAAAFHQNENSYRVYVEQLFHLFEKLNVTSFFITEIQENLLAEGGSAIEQFLADNVIIIYNIKKQNVRESAIEILKMRGAKFQKRIVAMQILGGVGIQVYPEQKIYGDTGK